MDFVFLPLGGGGGVWGGGGGLAGTRGSISPLPSRSRLSLQGQESASGDHRMKASILRCSAGPQSSADVLALHIEAAW